MNIWEICPEAKRNEFDRIFNLFFSSYIASLCIESVLYVQNLREERPNIYIFDRLFSQIDFLFSNVREVNVNEIDEIFDLFLVNVNDDDVIFGHANANEMIDDVTDVLNR